MAVMSLAISAAVALHVALLVGWQRDPGDPLQPVFIEYLGPECDCIFPVGFTFPLPPEPARPLHKVGPIIVHGPARGWATIRCDIGENGEATGCSPVEASEGGMTGQAADAVFKGFHGGARFANSAIEVTVRFQP